MQLQGDIISPSSGERKAAWNLVLSGLWHTQGPGEITGSVTASVQTVQGLLLLPGQRVAAGSIPAPRSCSRGAQSSREARGQHKEKCRTLTHLRAGRCFCKPSPVLGSIAWCWPWACRTHLPSLIPAGGWGPLCVQVCV